MQGHWRAAEAPQPEHCAMFVWLPSERREVITSRAFQGPPDLERGEELVLCASAGKSKTSRDHPYLAPSVSQAPFSLFSEEETEAWSAGRFV